MGCLDWVFLLELGRWVFVSWAKVYCFFVCVTVYGFGSGFLYFVCWESVFVFEFGLVCWVFFFLLGCCIWVLFFGLVEVGFYLLLFLVSGYSWGVWVFWGVFGVRQYVGCIFVSVVFRSVSLSWVLFCIWWGYPTFDPLDMLVGLLPITGGSTVLIWIEGPQYIRFPYSVGNFLTPGLQVLAHTDSTTFLVLLPWRLWVINPT